ncbi:MAG TPA: SGNH/GDSL hydrolase family protein [Verrucomicrobiales bacterium]|nr:SGNH/GDSL hydrolase family protein [Verrucomicrobiales bacterium]
MCPLPSPIAILATILLISGLAAPAAQAEDKKKTPASKKPNPVFAPVEDIAGLPRVLLIGDSISIGYTLTVRELLKGKANVHRIPTNGGPTSNGVENLKTWLGGTKWDVIHFNFGLHDMVYMGPDGKRGVDPKLPGAHHQVALPDYEKNLNQIVTELKTTGAKLIWCNTTPVPEGTTFRVADESVKFNEIAATVMTGAGVPINDLHTHAKARLTEIQLPANVHFSETGSVYLAEKVAGEIEKALK